jgi:hypothetical protein
LRHIRNAVGVDRQCGERADTVADPGGGQQAHDMTVLASAGYLTGRHALECEPGTMRYVVRAVTLVTPWDVNSAAA